MQIARHHRSSIAPKFRLGTMIGVAAAAVAAAAILNDYAARRAEWRDPPKGRFVEVDGIRLHYLEKGEGPPLVLVHGNVVTASDFVASGLFDMAAARYRVIAFDRPGMGYSRRPRGKAWTPAAQADLIRRACEALGIERPVVVGHSLGAMVAMALALDHPEAVSGLVLLGGYYYPTARIDAAMAAIQAVPVLADLLCYTLSPLTSAALMPASIKSMFKPAAVPQRFREHFRTRMAVRPWQLRSATQDGALMVPAAAAAQDRYGSLTIPLALLAGAKDGVADPQRQSVRLHQAIPQSSVRLVPDVGHMVHYAVPAEILKAIDRVSAQSLSPQPPVLAIAS